MRVRSDHSAAQRLTCAARAAYGHQAQERLYVWWTGEHETHARHASGQGGDAMASQGGQSWILAGHAKKKNSARRSAIS